MLANIEYWIYLIPVILISLTIHELAHGWVAYQMGDDTAYAAGRLTLNPMKHLDPIGALLLLVAGFGWAKPVPVNPYKLRGDKRKGMMLVSLAGPLSNFILAYIAGIFLNFTSGSDFWTIFLYLMIQINLVLFIFNLLPVPPLDGSKILAGLVPARYAAQIYQMERYGMIILFVLVILGATSYILGPLVDYLFKFILAVTGFMG